MRLSEESGLFALGFLGGQCDRKILFADNLW